MLSTIPEQSETWERRCGWPPQFSKCQWQKKTRWCWPEWRLFALCRNWMERSSCCSCPLIKKWKRKNYNFKINSHFHRQQFAIDFVWFVNAIGRLVTSGEKRTLENFWSKEIPTVAPCRYIGRRCRWRHPPSRSSTWSTSPGKKDFLTSAWSISL